MPKKVEAKKKATEVIMPKEKVEKPNILKNKINFVGYIEVNGANPNGDPTTNEPRMEDDYGRITQVCLKRKIRNRLQDFGERIFVQQQNRTDDGKATLLERYKESSEEVSKILRESKDFTFEQKKQVASIMQDKYMDVRLFGQIFPYNSNKSKKKDEDADNNNSNDGNKSVNITGCVSISPAISIDMIEIRTDNITKSAPFESGSDTMGTYHYVPFGVYKFYGSILPEFAKKNGVTTEDCDKLKNAIFTMFENDISNARPDGSMILRKLYWMEVLPEDSETDIKKTVISNPRYMLSRIKGNRLVDEPKKWEDYSFDDAELMKLQEAGVAKIDLLNFEI